MQEEWKDIKGYEGIYQISNKGKIKSCKSQRELKPNKSGRDGYLQVKLYKNRTVKNFLVHVLVAIAFIGEKKEGLEINHKDENKQNNRVDNLEWCTHTYNVNYGTRTERAKQHTDYSKLRESINIPLMIKRTKEACCIPVKQYDANNNLIAEYESIIEASRRTRIKRETISNNCKGRQQSRRYIWKFAN